MYVDLTADEPEDQHGARRKPITVERTVGHLSQVLGLLR
jgi:hypothetical protein